MLPKFIQAPPNPAFFSPMVYYYYYLLNPVIFLLCCLPWFVGSNQIPTVLSALRCEIPYKSYCLFCHDLKNPYKSYCFPAMVGQIPLNAYRLICSSVQDPIQIIAGRLNKVVLTRGELVGLYKDELLDNFQYSRTARLP